MWSRTQTWSIRQPIFFYLNLIRSIQILCVKLLLHLREIHNVLSSFIAPETSCVSLGISEHTLWRNRTEAAAGGGKRRQILIGWMCGAVNLLWGHRHQPNPLYGYVLIIRTARWNESNWFMSFMFSPWEDYLEQRCAPEKYNTQSAQLVCNHKPQHCCTRYSRNPACNIFTLLFGFLIHVCSLNEFITTSQYESKSYSVVFCEFIGYISINSIFFSGLNYSLCRFTRQWIT